VAGALAEPLARLLMYPAPRIQLRCAQLLGLLLHLSGSDASSGSQSRAAEVDAGELPLSPGAEGGTAASAADADIFMRDGPGTISGSLISPAKAVAAGIPAGLLRLTVESPQACVRLACVQVGMLARGME
jgi:hypothetical protein